MQIEPGGGAQTVRDATATAPGGAPRLNTEQRQAVEHGTRADGSLEPAPALLVIAGAGSGKTQTLACRVAHLIACGADPKRLLLLTFSRRAAGEMIRRVQVMQTRIRPGPAAAREGARRIAWAGTFHSVANRLLRLHARDVGLDPSFTVLDRGDAADLIDWIRQEQGLGGKGSRFPRKGTCLAIYSHTVNAQRPLADTLTRAFPWCRNHEDELRGLFAAYTREKQARSVLDYDDLLLWWYQLMSEPELASEVGARFDHVLVDEYQDTNALQAGILEALRPDGRGLTVVGDDAQSIYSFRAATVRNILDFPQRFEPPARVVTLERNYRSTRSILAACNGVIGLAREGFAKKLWSERSVGAAPDLVTVDDENAQVDWVVERILAHREDGIPLRRQAVLMRTAHHSDALEVELGRRDIPFVKYGGLKFLEAAHVKDVLCILRWAENPRDALAAFRVLQLLPGIGPGLARRALGHLERCGGDFARLAGFRAPAPAAAEWAPLCALMATLREARHDWHGHLAGVRAWYQPHLERCYDAPHVRAGDLEQLEQIAAGYPSRERFLTELSLDPPEASGDEAGPPHLDEDYLILSTIHSAKGQEWDVVCVLSVADGCIPSDMSTGSPEQIEEERRLLYVAMTRARDHLHLIHPLRYFVRQQHRHGDRHVLTPRTRFLPDAVLDRFARARGPERAADTPARAAAAAPIDVAARLRALWE